MCAATTIVIPSGAGRLFLPRSLPANASACAVEESSSIPLLRRFVRVPTPFVGKPGIFAVSPGTHVFDYYGNHAHCARGAHHRRSLSPPRSHFPKFHSQQRIGSLGAVSCLIKSDK